MQPTPPHQPPPPYVQPPPHMHGPPVDPLRQPLVMLIAGWSTLIVLSITGVLFQRLLLDGSEEGRALFATLSPIRTLLSVAGDGLLLAGAVLVARAGRPGSGLARIAAVGFGVSIAFTAGWYALSGVGSATVFRIFGFADSLVDIATLGSLVLSLRTLARSRGRSFDVAVVLVAVVLALSVLSQLYYAVASPSRDNPVRWVMLTASLAARVALIVQTWQLIANPPLNAPIFDQGSAYRGPLGAVAASGVEGSIPLGFLAGFFGGCIGLALVYALAKGPATKRGAAIGFACQSAAGIALRLAMR